MSRCRSENMNKISVILLITTAPWLLLSNSPHGAQGQRAEGDGNSNKPAFFIFGDSLLDAGNNNYIASLSRADWSPYGADFAPSGNQPTGRFTNGRTLTDILGIYFGQTELPQPYLAPTTSGQALLNGVNYASGAAGILNNTGANFVECLSLGTQINYFANTRNELIKMMGYRNTMQFFSRSVFFVAIGSNDYLDNYLLPNSPTQSRYSSTEFEQLLSLHLHSYLDGLYWLGGRKFVVSGVGALGCIPYQLSNAGSVGGECIAETNKLVVGFNIRLKNLTNYLNLNLPRASLVYLNTYDVLSQLIHHYKQYGFTNAHTACCGSGGRFKGGTSCLPGSPYCGDERNKYLFFDPYHPTEAVNVIFGLRFLNGGPNFVFPITIRQLVDL